MSWGEKIKLKRFLKKHEAETKSIQPGSYVFSGTYDASGFLNVLLAWPSHVYEHITVLEWRSIYDVDVSLSKKWLIQTWDYTAFVTNPQIIETYTQRYDFLAQAKKERGNITSLEGYLYPDTYYIDKDKNIVDQLVYVQLEWFQKKIWKPYGDELKNLSTHLHTLGFEFNLSSYGALIVASLIEKEERVDENKALIASIFFNRLNDNMQLDADISLCYGLEQWYEYCTPSLIVEHLYDKHNLYNTRAVAGLPPTPISNVTVPSIRALLDATKTPYYFYLHDKNWQIHTGENISQHNANKSKYLR